MANFAKIRYDLYSECCGALALRTVLRVEPEEKMVDLPEDPPRWLVFFFCSKNRTMQL